MSAKLSREYLSIRIHTTRAAIILVSSIRMLHLYGMLYIGHDYYLTRSFEPDRELRDGVQFLSQFHDREVTRGLQSGITGSIYYTS